MKISYSRIKEFLNCKRKYYYKYVLKVEINKFNVNFFVGTAMNHGISLIYLKDDEFVRKTIKFMEKEKQKIRETLLMEPKDEQLLYESEYNIRGMLKAYQNRYKTFIEEFTCAKSEFPLEYKFNDDVTIIGFIDNLLVTDGAYFLHELKTSRSLTPDYVKSIQNDLQTTIYYYTYPGPLHGIFYDIIKKPSIRQTKNENRLQFLKRLEEWYSDNPAHFHMEPLEKPLLSKERVWNIIDRVTKFMLTNSTEDEYYPNDTYCTNYGRCEFYLKCHDMEDEQDDNS